MVGAPVLRVTFAGELRINVNSGAPGRFCAVTRQDPSSPSASVWRNRGGAGLPAPGLAATRAYGLVPPDCGFPPVNQMAAPSGGGLSPRPAPDLAPQQQPEAVEVEGQHRESHDAGEALSAVGSHPVAASMLQAVDCRLDRRVLPARRNDLRVPFQGAVGPAQAPLARQHVVLEQDIKAETVGRGAEAAVEAAASMPSENCRCQGAPTLYAQ